MKLNKLDLCIMMPFMLAVVITYNYKFFYIAFLLIGAVYLLQVIRKKVALEAASATMLIYSYLLSDNFIVIGTAGILFIIFCIKGMRHKETIKIHRKTVIIFSAIVLFFVSNVVIGRVPATNILLYFMYNFVFIALPLIYFVFKPSITEVFDKGINTAILSQILFLIMFIPIQFNIILSNLIGDWAVGTLGGSGGVQLFNLFAFGSIKFLGAYIKERKLRDIAAFSICIIFSFFTVSLASTVIFMMALVIFLLLYIPSKKLKIAFLLSVAAFSMIFWFTSHPWIKDQLKSVILDPSFRQERIKKLKTYEDTFVKLPQKNLRVAIMGVGAGYYSSRAALTASGYYIDWYNSQRFKVNVSPYARKYIRPRIYQRKGLSIVDQPTSQYISIVGEYGYLGFIIFIAAAALLLKKSTRANKLTLIYFLISLSLDNYFEHPKIALIFWATYFILQQDKFKAEKLSLN